MPTPRAPPLNAGQQASAASRPRRQARYEEAARLRGIGATITRISAELGATIPQAYRTPAPPPSSLYRQVQHAEQLPAAADRCYR
jgi:hypothetical protein